MRQVTQENVIRRLLDQMQRKPAAGTTTLLDTERYRDSEEFQLEMTAMFRQRPVVVCHASQVAKVGDVVVVEVCGTSLLVTRSSQGVHVVVNACTHRGTRLLEESGCGKKALTCPYHAWSFKLDGELFHVPGREHFSSLDTSTLGLQTIPCESRHGMIWAVIEGDVISVSEFLGDELDADFDSFKLDDHIPANTKSRLIDANWKLVMDAFAEGYHLKSLHKRTLARFFLDVAIVDDFSPHVRQVGARKSLEEVQEDMSAWNVRQHATVFYNLFPNSILVFHPGWISLLTLWPKSVGTVRVDHQMLVPKGQGENSLEASFRLIDEGVFEKEDLMIAQNIYRSLGTGAQSTMILGKQEEGMRLFHSARDSAIGTTSK